MNMFPCTSDNLLRGIPDLNQGLNYVLDCKNITKIDNNIIIPTLGEDHRSSGKLYERSFPAYESILFCHTVTQVPAPNLIVKISVLDPGCSMFIPDPASWFFVHPGSRIQKQQQTRGIVKNFLSYLFVATNITKI